MEGDNGSQPKVERRAPQLTPDGPFSRGNQYRWVDESELTTMHRASHLRRLRGRFGTNDNGTQPTETRDLRSDPLLPGDFLLYQAMLEDALKLNPEQAGIQSSALRERYEQGTPADRERMGFAIGSMFNALYPEVSDGEGEIR